MTEGFPDEESKEHITSRAKNAVSSLQPGVNPACKLLHSGVPECPLVQNGVPELQTTSPLEQNGALAKAPEELDVHVFSQPNGSHMQVVVFIEVHDEQLQARSDKAQALPEELDVVAHVFSQPGGSHMQVVVLIDVHEGQLQDVIANMQPEELLDVV